MTDLVKVLLSRSVKTPEIPTDREFRLWVNAACRVESPTQISIKIVEEAESQQLNCRYRNKNEPTNVLSFPMHAPLEDGTELLGDLVICAPVVKREAQQQAKSEKAHWAHMIIHGVLHLQGYDHEAQARADEMEQIEVECLAKLGYVNPYV